MPTPDTAGLKRLARLVAQRRVELGWHKADAAKRAELTITTYSRIESGLTVRDVTYAKLERALGWAPGACLAILEGAERAQPAGEVSDGVRYVPAESAEDGARQAVVNAVMATLPETPAGKISEFSDAVIKELKKRGIVPSRDAASSSPES